MEAVTTGFSNPHSFDAGTNDYVEAAAERARHSPNLVDCFIAAMTAEKWAISYIPQWLNKKLGGNIGYPRMREWATGARNLPDEVAMLMAEKAIPWILKEVEFGSGTLPEEVLRGLVARTFPWAAKINQPGRKPTNLSAEREVWLVAALMPPPRQEIGERKPRKVRRAPRKTKPGKSGTPAKKSARTRAKS